MKFLHAAREGAIEGSRLSTDARRALFAASAEFLACSASSRSVQTRLIPSQRGGIGETFERPVEDPTYALGGALTEWDERLLRAFASLMAVEREVPGLHGDVLQARTSAALLIDDIHAEGNSTAEFTFDAAHYLRLRLDYGLVPLDSLAVGLAQDLRVQDPENLKLAALVISQMNDKSRPAFPASYEGASLTMFPGVVHCVVPEPLAKAAYLIDDSRRFGLENIAPWIDRTLAVLDNADGLASIARKSTVVSTYLEAAHAALILYSLATLSLQWILERYQKAQHEVPLDLGREHQIAEENRVEVRSMLESSGYSLVNEPIAHAMACILDIDRVPSQRELRDFVVDGISRIVVYPDNARRAWEEVAESIDFSRVLDPAGATYRVGRVLQGEMQLRMVDCFEDREFARLLFQAGAARRPLSFPQ